ncbi:unnamed protein product [Aphanomyces euteiches]
MSILNTRVAFIVVLCGLLGAFADDIPEVCSEQICQMSNGTKCDRGTSNCPPCLKYSKDKTALCVDNSFLGKCIMTGGDKCPTWTPAPTPAPTTTLPTPPPTTTVTTKVPTTTASTTTTTPSSSSDQTSSQSSDSGSSHVGTYIGIGIGAVVVLAVAGFIVARFKRLSDDEDDEDENDSRNVYAQPPATKPVTVLPSIASVASDADTHSGRTLNEVEQPAYVQPQVQQPAYVPQMQQPQVQQFQVQQPPVASKPNVTQPTISKAPSDVETHSDRALHELESNSAQHKTSKQDGHENRNRSDSFEF